MLTPPLPLPYRGGECLRRPKRRAKNTPSQTGGGVFTVSHAAGTHSLPLLKGGEYLR